MKLRNTRITVDYDRVTYDVHIESNECEYTWEEIGCISTLFIEKMTSVYDDEEFETFMKVLHDAVKIRRNERKKESD